MLATNPRLIILLISLFLFLATGCVGLPPIEEYNIAYTSLSAARQVQASRYAPGFFSQAEEFYRQAVADYNDRRYKSALANFQRCQKFAERAENYTVLKRAEAGDFQ